MEKNVRKRVDFHTHADPLDIESGKRVVDLAAQNNVVAVAVFAREQVLPYYDMLIDYGRNKGISVITGIETLTFLNNKPVEIIGLGYDHQKMMKEKGFREIEANKQIAEHQIAFLESKGFVFSGDIPLTAKDLLKDVKEGLVSEKAIRLCEVVALTPGLKPLVEKYISLYSELWKQVVDKFSTYRIEYQTEAKMRAKLLYQIFFDVNKEGFNYVKSRRSGEVYTVKSQISEIHSCGGVALYSPEGMFDQAIWKECRASGIDGIMAWHADSLGYESGERDVPRELIKECVANNLLILGGSDYNGKDWKVGTGRNGRLYMSVRRFESLKNATKSYY